jgi:hippurate hydrolase
MVDSVTIVVHGRGGHAAMPMNTVDPVVLAARLVLALQTIVSRENNPTDPVVVTVGSIHGGTQGNIIPDEVRLQLSVRTYTLEVRQKTLAAIQRIAHGEAVSAGAPEPEVLMARAESSVRLGVVYNDPALTSRLAGALKAGLGDKSVIEMPAKMTSEDFGEYWNTGKVPSALLHIGAVNARKFEEIQKTGIPGPAPHSPEWAPDREPTIKGAIRAEVTELIELLQ